MSQEHRPITESIMSSYQREFPSFGPMPINPPAGWVDASWHNNTCPSYELPNKKGEPKYTLWVDFEKIEDRELPNECRFNLVRWVGDAMEDGYMLSTNDPRAMDRVMALLAQQEQVEQSIAATIAAAQAAPGEAPTSNLNEHGQDVYRDVAYPYLVQSGRPQSEELLVPVHYSQSPIRVDIMGEEESASYTLGDANRQHLLNPSDLMTGAPSIRITLPNEDDGAFLVRLNWAEAYSFARAVINVTNVAHYG